MVFLLVIKKKDNITLNALYIGYFHIKCNFIIDYKSEFKEFNITFNVVDLPIFSDIKFMNLIILFKDQIFREKISLINKSKKPYYYKFFSIKI